MLSIYRIDRRIDFNQSQFFSRFWFLQSVSSTTTWNYVKGKYYVHENLKEKKKFKNSKITSRWWGFLYSHSCFCGGWATSFLNWDDFFLNNEFNIRIKFGLELATKINYRRYWYSYVQKGTQKLSKFNFYSVLWLNSR